MAGNKTPRHPQKILDDLRIELALETFRLKKRGSLMTFPTYAELERAYKPRQKAVLHRAVREAFVKGLVEIRRVPGALNSTVSRNASLEERLAQRYGHLREVFVLEEGGGEQESVDRKTPSDEIHRTLGQFVGKYIASGGGGVFEDGGTLAIGSGRAVFHTVQALAKAAEGQFRYQDIQLVSLSGRAGAKDHSGHSSKELDADLHVFLLACSIERQLEAVHYIYSPIGCRSSSEKNAKVRGTALEPDRWSSFPRVVAVIGIGILAQGHCFFEGGEVNQPLEPVKADLAKLKQLTLQVTDYCPIGDVCNRLFYVPPPPDVTVPSKLEDQIKKLVGDINDRLHNVTSEQLRRENVEKIILVAGTVDKAPAMVEVLSRYENIRILCTDGPTAEEILRIAGPVPSGD